MCACQRALQFRNLKTQNRSKQRNKKIVKQKFTETEKD